MGGPASIGTSEAVGFLAHPENLPTTDAGRLGRLDVGFGTRQMSTSAHERATRIRFSPRLERAKELDKIYETMVCKILDIREQKSEP